MNIKISTPSSFIILLITLILALTMAASSAHAQSLNLSVSPTTVAPGGTATATITFADSTPSSNVAAFEWTLVLPPGVSGVAATAGTASTAQSKTVTCSSSNPLLCIDLSYNTPYNFMPVGNGVLATIPLTVSTNAALGALPLSITKLFAAGLVASGAQPVTLMTTGATLTVTSKYDLDGNGVLNGADVTLAVNQTLAQTCTGTFAAVGDGLCNVYDAFLELLAVVGTIH